jgi:hypothetical protein
MLNSLKWATASRQRNAISIDLGDQPAIVDTYAFTHDFSPFILLAFSRLVVVGQERNYVSTDM